MIIHRADTSKATKIDDSDFYLLEWNKCVYNWVEYKKYITLIV